MIAQCEQMTCELEELVAQRRQNLDHAEQVLLTHARRTAGIQEKQ